MLHKSKFKTFLWYSSVGLLVTIAVAVSLFRVYFSSVEEYRDQLAAMAGSYLGQPVTISGMDARVVGLSPTVILTDVSLLHKDGQQLLTRFDSIDIALDPIASLRNLRPIIELIVSGANLEVTRNRDGTFGVKGLELSEAQKPSPADEEQAVEAGTSLAEEDKVLGSWFLSQSRLALRDSHIILHNEESGERYRFEQVALELYNDAERHRLNASVNLPKSIGHELRLAIDIKGNLLEKKEWSGALYLKTEQLQSQQWLQQLSWQGSSIQQGTLNLELWSQWQGGELESVESRLQAVNLVLARGKQRDAFPLLSTDLQLLHHEGSWQLNVTGLRLQHAEKEASPMHLSLNYSPEEFMLSAEKIQLGPLGALLPYLPQLDDRMQEMVHTMAPSGEVNGLHLRRSAQQVIEFQAELSAVAIEPWERLPGLQGIEGTLLFNGERGRLDLHTDNAVLSMPRLFRQPLPLEKLEAPLELRREGEEWQLFGDAIAVANHDLEATLALELRLAQGRSPWLSLQGRFQGADARAVPRYLPTGILKEKTLYWLDNAFKAGKVSSGRLQFHGFTKQFPFREQQGRFEVLFDASEVDLHYQDGWPGLRKINGEVHFDGPAMTISADSARLFSGRLGKTRVSIENLRAAQLRVDGRVKFPINDGLRFLRESPLSRHTGKMLDTMQGKGDASLVLQLAIPLSPSVGEKRPLEVQGRVAFDDNQLAVIEGVNLQQLTGELKFTEQSFTAEQLQAVLYGHPVSLAVMTESGERNSVEIAASGRAGMEPLRQAFGLGLLDYLQGEAAWQMSLSLPRGVSAEGVVLHLSSDLVGVTSKLPHPLAKELAVHRDIGLTFYLSGERIGERQLTLKDKFGMVWRQGAQGKLRRAQLRLGASAPLQLPARDAIELVGSGENLPLAGWREVLRSLTDSETRSAEEGADDKAEGPKHLPLDVAMETLHLVSLPEPADEPELAHTDDTPAQISDVPPVNIAVGQFSYDDISLGKVGLKLVPQAEQVVLKDIKFESQELKVSAKGSWNGSGSSLFEFNLSSPDLGAMMERLGFATVIQGGRAEASGSLWWAGAPTEATLEGLNGQLGVSVKEGIILDVDPGAGRMLGILSIPALPRRLFLDFSDVFKEGFAFESIKGDIRIEQGQAYTTNLQLESVPAAILMTGRTGLATQDFDQDVYVAPNISDTATVASALAWGPQVAAVVALFQEIFKSDIKASTMTQYHLSGSWQNPIVRRVDAPSEEEDEPLFYE